MRPEPPILFILTGLRLAGKTTFCRHLAASGRAAGRQVGGILSPAVFEGGQKVAIDALELRTGRRRRLATRRRSPEPGRLGWQFDPAGLAWGNAVLQRATPCHLLIVDELGPLEFRRGQGWQAGLAALDGGHYRWGVVVIRPELLAPARSRWPAARLISLAKGAATAQAARRLGRLWPG